MDPDPPRPSMETESPRSPVEADPTFRDAEEQHMRSESEGEGELRLFNFGLPPQPDSPRFVLSPEFQYAEAMLGLGSRSASTNSDASSNSSLATVDSDESAQMGTARASTRHSSQDFGDSILETSMSRKQGWLPFPPAKVTTSDSSAPTDEAPYDSRAGRNGDSRSPASPTQHVEPTAGKSSRSPTQRMKMYEIKVKKLNYKLSPPKYPALSKFISLFTRSSAIEQPLAADRYILRNISFEAKPSELLAIAGPSGAGKSTLLECLAGRLSPTSGSILVNNQTMDPSTFRRISGYVMQDDALFPNLTVMETLMISARLRLPATMSKGEKLTRVQALLWELGLQQAAHTRIGNYMTRGTSGGEKRRVSIGVDVIHDPAVLFLDEPTSGLDSAAALNVIGMLREMAVSRGRTVILSIHQPSFRMLKQMHSILLLAGGLVVHHGSLEFLASRLASAGHEVPARTNVLEYAIDAVNSWESEELIGTYATIAKGLTLQEILSPVQKENDGILSSGESGEIAAVDVENGGPPDKSDAAHGGSGSGDGQINYVNNVLHETVVLTERFFKNILRTKELFTARSLQALLAGVILGTVFLNVDNNPQGVSERLGLFVFTISFLLNSTTEALPIFLQERQILMRETSRGAYRISSYVLSHTVVFVPFLLIIAILYASPSYWLAGLDSSIGKFAFYCLVLWLTLLLANSFVAFFSAVVPNYIMGQALIAAFMGAFFLFSGYIINSHNIPKYWIWMHYISLFKYPFDSLLLNEFGSHRDKCYDDRNKASFHQLSRAPAASPMASSGCDRRHLLQSFQYAHGNRHFRCTLTGSRVLHNAGVQGHQKWFDVLAMVGFILLYRLLSYFAVRWRLTEKIR